jgi:hypothetical protein
VHETPETPESVAASVTAGLDRLVALVLKDAGLPPANRLAQVSGAALSVTLPLHLDLGGPQETRSAALLALVRDHVLAAVSGASAFKDGRVYCFHTESVDSPYSAPPHATDVFAGYAANGRPEWVSFPNLCLSRREPRVDRLYGDHPEVIALIVGPDELEAGLLPEFGRGSLVYRVLGQVVVGLVPRDLNLRSRAERVALTLQVVETSQPGLAHRLRLNVIGLPLDDIAEAAAGADATSPAEAFRKVLRATRGRIDGLGRRAALARRQGGAFDLQAPVMQLLARLRGDVLRVLKSRDHRTRHAEERHQSGERPTALALSDALQAGEGRYFLDEHKQTLVVLGPKHRVHVFTKQGKHVTSLELLPAEVERRVDLRRWRFLERAECERFRESLRRTLETRED